MFNDDTYPLVVEDCLYQCVMEDALSTHDNPRFRTTGVLNHTNGSIGAVSGFTVGDTDPLDPVQFDLLLVFYWESDPERLRFGCKLSVGGFFQQISVNNQPFYCGLCREIRHSWLGW